MFLNSSQAGKGSHDKLGKLVLRPLTKLKDALEEYLEITKKMITIKML